MNAAEKKIIDTVATFSDDMLDFTTRLTAEPSTLGNEASVLEVMESELSRLSFDPVRVSINPAELAEHPGWAPVPWDYGGRYNVVAVRQPSGEGGRSGFG